MKHVVVGTAGHIDHGKSALVQALTGTDPDRLREEKERGITIDLGFAFLRTNDVHLGLVDVPGHERFVKNMLAGVGGIDIVLLVVAADESIMPQTREHFEICRFLNIPRGIIAITKCDLVDEELRELATVETQELVAGSFLEGAPVLHVSSKSREGLKELEKTLVSMSSQVVRRTEKGLFRLPIDRVFSMKGFGTVVTGTSISGAIERDEEVEVQPSGVRTRVRGLQADGKKQERVTAGQRTAVNLQGVDVSQVARGDVLVRPGTFASTMMVDAEIEVLLGSPVPVKDLLRVHLHIGTSQVLARVRVLGPIRAIKPGERGFVQLRLETAVVIAPLDRFIVRRYSPLETIAGGVVLDTQPHKHAVKNAHIVTELGRLQDSDSEEVAAVFILEAGSSGLTERELAVRLGIDGDAARNIAKSLVVRGKAIDVSSGSALLLAPSVTKSSGERLLQVVLGFQQQNPLRDGMPKGELKEKAAFDLPDEAFQWLVAHLVEGKKIRTDRDVVATVEHRIQMTNEELDARVFLESSYRQAGYQPQTLKSMAQEDNRKVEVLQRVERVLLREGMLVQIAEGLVFHREALEGLKQAVKGYKSRSDRIDVAVFKNLAGVTRKHAIPLLEWLDRQHVTRRVGNERIIL